MKTSHRLSLLAAPCAALLVGIAALRLRSTPDTSAPPRRFARTPLFTAENKEKVRRELGITAEQQARIEALYAQSDRRTAELGGAMRGKMREIHSLYDDYTIDAARQATLGKELAAIQESMFQAHADTENKLREILTSEQFARLHTLLKQRRDRARRDLHSRRAPTVPLH